MVFIVLPIPPKYYGWDVMDVSPITTMDNVVLDVETSSKCLQSWKYVLLPGSKYKCEEVISQDNLVWVDNSNWITGRYFDGRLTIY